MISGMYLGEVARQVIVSLVEDGCLFNGVLSEKLGTPLRFYTKYISEIERSVIFLSTTARSPVTLFGSTAGSNGITIALY